MDLALNNLQWLICHKTKLKQTNSSRATTQNMYKSTMNAIPLSLSIK